MHNHADCTRATVRDWPRPWQEFPISAAPITDSAMLDAAVASLSGSEAIGVDTEFMRERTYYAQLCLVQLGSGQHAVCVDPLALPSLDALRPLMGAPRPCKILHAARQDLEVLAPAVGTVRNVFDTQVAAALAGFPAQVGYADLVRQVLGVELHKSQTRTDWSRRPLSAAQIEYALDDVRHLPPLLEQLSQRLEQLGRSAWFAEEMAQIGDESFIVDPEQAWLRIKTFADLDADRQRLAQSLAAWRERRAMASDRPRGWILPDAALRDIVLQVPRDAGALERIRELPDGIRANSGPQILELVSAAGVPNPAAPLPQRRRPDTRQLDQVARLADLSRRIAGTLQLAPEVLATRRELEALVRGEQDGALLRGWRREAIGLELLRAL